MADTTEPVRPQDYPVTADALAVISHDHAIRHRICPLAVSKNAKGERELTVASEHPNDLQLLETLQQLARCHVRAVPATAHDISLGISYHYSMTQVATAAGLFSVPNEQPTYNARSEFRTTQTEREPAESVSVTQQLNRIMQFALAQRATDIHFEPHEQTVYVRFRVDGLLADHCNYPAEQHPQMAARIKVICNLDVAQNRLPQDGRFDVQLGERQYDIRVSLLPTVCGECVVLRLLPKGALSVGFDDLGMTEPHYRLLDASINAPSGMVLLTGPTGSGKTTTLYACLSRVDCITRKVATIEDPVEYQFHRIAQTQVNPRIGLTFANGLRSILRQDPDIIMVGEIRDLETMEIAVHSALTGHLVLSTLHCNDAAAAASRLIDMGAEPFLIASSVTCIVAQRLVRKICTACKQPLELSEGARVAMGLSVDDTVYYHGRGCTRCGGAGYYGRTSVFEVMPVTSDAAEIIAARAGAGEIRRHIRSLGVRSLRDDGLEKARAGITTLEEVMRAVSVDPV